MKEPCQQESRLSDELKLIPRWSIVAAVVAFALVEYYFWVVLPAHVNHPSRLPVALRTYLIFSWGALAALSMLVIGYISNDAPRRGMSARLWMICVVIPGGVGVALYFLLRQSILSACPSCGTHIAGDYHYCPQCSYQVMACCGTCHKTARITDIYCVYCGHELAKDHPPARLHAFGN